MQKLRHRFKQSQSLEERLANEAERLRKQALLLPPSNEREDLLMRAREAEVTLELDRWLTSHRPRDLRSTTAKEPLFRAPRYDLCRFENLPHPLIFLAQNICTFVAWSVAPDWPAGEQALMLGKCPPRPTIVQVRY
jgi:hypothetical protein